MPDGTRSGTAAVLCIPPLLLGWSSVRAEDSLGARARFGVLMPFAAVAQIRGADYPEVVRSEEIKLDRVDSDRQADWREIREDAEICYYFDNRECAVSWAADWVCDDTKGSAR